MSSRKRARSRSGVDLDWLAYRASAPSGASLRRRDYGYSRPAGGKKTFILRDTNTLRKYGPSARRANAEQLVNRRADSYYGRGMYMGQGGYWGKLAGKALGWLGEKVIPVPGLASMAEKVGDKLGDMVSWNPTKLVPERFQSLVPSHMRGQGTFVRRSVRET